MKHLLTALFVVFSSATFLSAQCNDSVEKPLTINGEKAIEYIYNECDDEPRSVSFFLKKDTVLRHYISLFDTKTEAKYMLEMILENFHDDKKLNKLEGIIHSILIYYDRFMKGYYVYLLNETKTLTGYYIGNQNVKSIALIVDPDDKHELIWVYKDGKSVRN